MGTVLVVDDVSGNRRLLESLLAPDGHAVCTASDGAEALRLVRAKHPDLVLMDVMMPHIDGFEACRAIKQDPSTRLIPVVLITALNDTASRVRGIEAGAVPTWSPRFSTRSALHRLGRPSVWRSNLSTRRSEKGPVPLIPSEWPVMPTGTNEADDV